VARINIVNAKNLNNDVKITCLPSGSEYSRICKNINPEYPEWNQAFYIPIYDINEKFKIKVYDNNAFFKSTSLGSYTLDTENLIEGKKLVLERDLEKPKNRILRITPRPNKGELRLDVDFYSFSTTKSIKFSNITIIFYITYQCKDGSFKPTNKLANLFNFNSKDELIKEFTDTIKNDEELKALHIDNWDTVLIAGNLIPFISITLLLLKDILLIKYIS
jgi:hypothetical protein